MSILTPINFKTYTVMLICSTFPAVYYIKLKKAKLRKYKKSGEISIFSTILTQRMIFKSYNFQHN